MQIFCLTLPDVQNIPLCILKHLVIPPVATNIALDFGSPELRSGFRCNAAVSAIMPMPKATMNEDDFSPT